MVQITDEGASSQPDVDVSQHETGRDGASQTSPSPDRENDGRNHASDESDGAMSSPHAAGRFIQAESAFRVEADVDSQTARSQLPSRTPSEMHEAGSAVMEDAIRRLLQDAQADRDATQQALTFCSSDTSPRAGATTASARGGTTSGRASTAGRRSGLFDQCSICHLRQLVRRTRS